MARQAARPRFLELQFVTLADKLPTAAGWIFEIKYDGYRTLAAANGKTVRCYSRKGLD